MLTDADGFELVLPDGLVAGEGCDDECCGGCWWYTVRECPTAIAGCGVVTPLPRFAYVWSCIQCAAGDPPLGSPARPLVAGDIFRWMDSCWEVLDLPTVPQPPKGALSRKETTPVQCAGTDGCDSPVCPRPVGPVYYIATPCDPSGEPSVAVCGFAGTCGVFLLPVVLSDGTVRFVCYVVRRESPVPGDQVPPSTQRFDVTGVAYYTDCCTCLTFEDPNQHARCGTSRVWRGALSDCYLDDDTAMRRCCCPLDENGLDEGRLRVSEFTLHQVVSWPGFPSRPRFTLDRTIENEQIGPAPDFCAVYTIREHFVETDLSGVVTEDSTLFFSTDAPDYVSIGLCRECGWGTVYTAAFIGGRLVAVGFSDCHGSNAPGSPGHVPTAPWVTVRSWTFFVDCGRLRFTAEFDWFDPQSNQTIYNRVVTDMHRVYPGVVSGCVGGCDGGNGVVDGGREGGMDAVIAVRDGKRVGGAKKSAAAGGGGVPGADSGVKRVD